MDSVRWRFAGAYQPLAKYFPLRHKIVLFDEKPFLVVTNQGAAGTGLSTESEEWIDLTAAKFEPVLTYTAEGHYHAPGRAYVSVETRGSVTALKNDPAESIAVDYAVSFSHESDSGKTFDLGSRNDSVVYVRIGEKFSMDEGRSTLSSSQLEQLYSRGDDNFTCDDLVRYDLDSLKTIATDPTTNGETKREITQYLNRCSDTASKSELLKLLQRGS